MKTFRRFVGWVARSKTQHNHTDTLEMLGFILLLGALIRREARRTRIRNPTYPKRLAQIKLVRYAPQ
jgi:hypothetical protein